MASVPFDQLEGFIWMNGEFVKWADAKIHVLTHGLHYASAVFEGERAYGGEIFKLNEHTRRLHDSAKILGFTIPYSVETIDAACREVLKANNLVDAYMRPVAWRGSEQMGVTAGDAAPHVAIAAWEWGKYFDPEKAAKGLRLDVASYRRPAPYTAPVHSKAAGLYMICTLARQQAEARGYDDPDAVMASRRAQAEALVDSGDTKKAIGVCSAALGGAMILGYAVWRMLERPDESAQARTEEARSERGLDVVVSPSAASLAWSGRF